MLVQEIGFDVVSMWNQMGFIAKGIIAIPVLIGSCLIIAGIRDYLAAKKNKTGL